MNKFLIFGLILFSCVPENPYYKYEVEVTYNDNSNESLLIYGLRPFLQNGCVNYQHPTRNRGVANTTLVCGVRKIKITKP